MSESCPSEPPPTEPTGACSALVRAGRTPHGEVLDQRQWKAAPGQARHKLTVRLPASLRAEVDLRWSMVRGQPAAAVGEQLSRAESLADLVALSCHRLCSQIEQYIDTPALQQSTAAGSATDARDGISQRHLIRALRYLAPWDHEPAEAERQLSVRIPTALYRRLVAALDGLRDQPEVVRPAELDRVSSLRDLVALACHQLCQNLPVEPARQRLTPTAPSPPWALDREGTREQLNVVVPAALGARVRGLRDWLVTEPDVALPTELARVDSLRDLVALACHRLCTQFETAHHQGAPFPELAPRPRPGTRDEPP